MADNLKQKAFSGVIWSAISRFSVQGLAFVFNLIIARKLMPEAYGVIAIISVFLSFFEVFVDSGFGNALIRKKDRTEEDISTVFYFNLAVSVFCYLIIFVFSPVIARFYEMPLLQPVMRVIGLSLILNAISSIQQTILTIKIDFRLKTRISLIASVMTGTAGVVMVYKGLGVWALALQQLFSSILGSVLYWCFVRWRPLLAFSVSSFKELFSYGSRILATGLLNSIYGNISSLIVGKVYSAEDLGEYSKARSLAIFPSNNLNSVIMSVAFPVLSSIQDQSARLENYYKKITNLLSYLMFPIMIGMAAVADPLIRVLLTDNWSGIIPMFQLSCFAGMWLPLNSVNLNLLQVKGRSDYFLRIELYKKIQGLIVLCVTIPLGVVAMCWGTLVASIINIFVNAYYTKKLLGYGVIDQLKGVFHILIHTLVMGVIAYLATELFENNIHSLILGVLSGAIYYISISYVMKFPELYELVMMVSEKLNLVKNNQVK